jgi:hypothetical protein
LFNARCDHTRSKMCFRWLTVCHCSLCTYVHTHKWA